MKVNYSFLRKAGIITILSMFTAWIIYLCVPAEYHATAKLSDETEEMNLLIGLNQKTAQRKYNETYRNSDIYHKFLDSEEFIDKISHISINGKTYEEHIRQTIYSHKTMFAHMNMEKRIWNKPEEQYIREQISGNIQHAYKASSSTITIRVADSDPCIAAAMADSIIAQLQSYISDKRKQREIVNLKNTEGELHKAKAELEECQRAYSDFVDTHRGVLSADANAVKEDLRKDIEQRRGLLAQIHEKHIRALFLSKQSVPTFTIIKNTTVPTKPAQPQYLVIFIVCLFILSLITWWHHLYRNIRQRFVCDFGNLFSPWFITILIWIAIITLIKLSGNLLYPLTEQFYISISLWIPALCITSFITYQLLKEKSNTGVHPPIEINETIYNILFLISIICTPMYVWQVYQIVSEFNTADMMNNIRILATHGEGQGWLKYTVVINQAIFLVSLWRYPKIPLWKLIVVYVCNILCALSLMEKGTFFMLTICTLFYLFDRKKIRTHTIVMTGVVVVIAFYAFTAARQFTESGRNADLNFIDFFSIYVTSPSVAFCQCVRDLSGQIGINTFEVFYDFLNRFGIGNFEVLSKEQDFVLVPVLTNVYTIMQPFYIDFGYGGVAFFGCVYGVLTGILYSLYKRGDATFSCIYTFLVQILVLQFYQENIFLSISGLTQLVILITLMTQKYISVTFIPQKTK